MHSSHSFAGRSAVLDENNIISCVGLAPVMGLAKQIGLTALLTEKVAITLRGSSPGRQNRSQNGPP